MFITNQTISGSTVKAPPCNRFEHTNCFYYRLISNIACLLMKRNIVTMILVNLWIPIEPNEYDALKFYENFFESQVSTKIII